MANAGVLNVFKLEVVAPNGFLGLVCKLQFLR